jgi:hypothetical protein
MAKAIISGQTAINILENGLTTKLKEKESISTKIKEFIAALGRITRCMAKESIHGLIKEFTGDPMIRTRNMDTESMYMLEEKEPILEIG